MLKPYQRNTNEEFDFDLHIRWLSIEKRTEEGRNKQNVRVSSKKIRMRKEEGATVAATPYLLLSWLSRQAGPAAFFHGRIQKH